MWHQSFRLSGDRMRTKVLSLALIVPVLAGCIGGISESGVDDGIGDDTLDEAVAALQELLAADHDHQDPLLHNDSKGLTEVGWHALIGEEDQPGAYTEIDLHDDHVLMVTKVPVAGFVIVDVSDPAEPELVSWTRSGHKYAPDAKWGPDGDWVFTGAHLPGYNADNAGSITDHEGPHPLGINAWDASDKTDVTHSSYLQCGTSGVHNVNVAEIDGTIYVFGACYDSYLNRVVIAEFEPTTGQLIRLGEFSLGDLVAGNVGSVHDMVVNEDPVDGKPVLTVSYGNQGVVWVDVTDPVQPEMLGQWTWEGSEHVRGDHPRFLHYAELYEETVDGRRITVAAPEYGGHGHTGQAWIVNTTDYEAPELIGAWDGAANVSYSGNESDPSALYRYSPHNFKLQDGIFYIANNHAGVWAVDFATSLERLRDPKPVGFFAAANDPGHEVPIDSAPDFWGIDLDEDHVYVSDRGTGLYVLEMSDDAGHIGHSHEH